MKFFILAFVAFITIAGSAFADCYSVKYHIINGVVTSERVLITINGVSSFEAAKSTGQTTEVAKRKDQFCGPFSSQDAAASVDKMISEDLNQVVVSEVDPDGQYAPGARTDFCQTFKNKFGFKARSFKGNLVVTIYNDTTGRQVVSRASPSVNLLCKNQTDFVIPAEHTPKLSNPVCRTTGYYFINGLCRKIGGS